MRNDSWLPILVVACVAACGLRLSAQSVDQGFAPDVDGIVYSIAAQPDGKLLIAGGFTLVNSVSRNCIARLNLDGSLDASLDPGAGTNGVVQAVGVQSNGKVVIAGDFTTVNGVGRNYIARLNSDGSVDTSFNPNANNTLSGLSVLPNDKVAIIGAFSQVGGVSRGRVALLNADGSVDTAFAPSSGANSTVHGVAVQPDGKILICGFFSSVSGVSRNRIARFNADGSLDMAFDPNASSTVYSIAVQADGKIVLGGQFTSVASGGSPRISRVNPDGTYDASFNAGSGADSTVFAIAVQADQRLLIAGGFTNIGGTAINRIARLSWDGSIDATFNPGAGANAIVESLAILPDGNVFLGGQFQSVDGIPRTRVARLDPFGNLDVRFVGGGSADSYVRAQVVQPDGKIVVVGEFTTFGGLSRNRVARLNADGTIDTTFDPGAGADERIFAVALQADGKVVIGGLFTSVDGTSRGRIARLNADGSLDTGFNPGSGADDRVVGLAVQADGRIVLGGHFTTVGGVTRRYIARLNADGSLDNAYNPDANSPVYSLALQPDQKTVIVGDFTFVGGQAKIRTARLNTNGTADTTYTASTDTPTHCVAILANGKIVIGGGFTFVNGTSRVRIAQLNSDGSLDTSFDPGAGANDFVFSLSVQSSNKVILGGQFTSVGGQTRNFVARLNTDGSVDTAFNPGADFRLFSTGVQPDDKILLGGSFTQIAGSESFYFARLDASGSLDAGFAASLGPNDGVRSVVPHAGGYTVVGGLFTSVGPVGRNRVARIASEGAVDTSFNIGAGTDGDVYATVAERDGKLVIGGAFTTVNGVSHLRIARMNANGSLDSSFTASTDNSVFALAVQPDGKFIVGGTFLNVNGTSRVRIARLNSDGSLDSTFNPGGGADNTVFTAAVQPDGRIVIGGSFANIDGVARTRIARLNSDGSLDTSFNPGAGASSAVHTLVLQPDGKVLVGGQFTSLVGASRSRIGRLNSDGSLDTAFDTTVGPAGTVWSIALQSNGQVLIGGGFVTVGSTSCYRCARLNSDGSLDTAFDTSTGVDLDIRGLSLVRDGKILIAGDFTHYDDLGAEHISRLTNTSGANQRIEHAGGVVTWTLGGTMPMPSNARVELSSDGINFSFAGFAQWNGSAWELSGVALSTGLNWIRASGNVPGGYRSSSSYDLRFDQAVFVASSTPIMAVSRGTTPVNNGGTDTVSGAVAGSGTALTYTIANSGGVVLNLTVPVSAPTVIANCTATITTQPTGQVGTSSNTTLVVTVTPVSSGAFSCSVSINNDDPANDPYVWTISGTAASAPVPQMQVTRGANPVTNGGTDTVFGAAAGSGSALTYTISNSGSAALNLTVPVPAPTVITNCTATITTQPSGQVGTAANTTMIVTVTPVSSGGFSCSISIDNDDPANDPYIWTMSGTAAAVPPVMEVTRSATTIPTAGTDALGAIPAGAATTVTYSIANQGGSPLLLTGTPNLVVVSLGANVSSAVVTTNPGTPIAAGNATTFVITYTVSAAGVFDFSVSIDNNDPAASPYLWTVSGTGTAPDPEMDVTRNSVVIADSGTDSIGSTLSGQSATLSYVIENNGAGSLNLTGAPLVEVSGEINCSAVVILSPPATTAPSASSSFEVSVSPASVGAFSFTISIANNDPDENPYNWFVLGTATASGGGGSGGGGGGGGDDGGCATSRDSSTSIALVLATVAILSVASRLRRRRSNL
jgi:uncharacterized delta-60 repeat protein